MKFRCECSGICGQTIELPLEEYQQNIMNAELILIIDNCPVWLVPGDVLVDRKEGYTLYRETTSQPTSP